MSTDDTRPMRPPGLPTGDRPSAAEQALDQAPAVQQGFGQPGFGQQGFGQPASGQQQYAEPQDDRPHIPPDSAPQDGESYTRPYEQPYDTPYAGSQFGGAQYGQPGYPPPPNAQPQDRPPRFGRLRRRRRVRRSIVVVFTILVLAILLTIGDRVGNAVAENDMASQFTANGFPVKPSVTIEGIPFLTQLAAKDFKKVDISASNIPAGPVTIDSMHATITGMHISGFSSSASAHVDHVVATAFISFGALAAAGGLGGGTGITITQDGPDKLKVTAGLGGVFSDSEEAVIKQTGPQTISVQVLNSGSVVGQLLNAFGAFSFSLPKGVPASLRITALTLNSQGLTVSAAASNATFSQ
jgi:hypothetical protein